MKLFTKYNRINLLATVIIFLLSGLAFYIALRLVLLSQIDDDLKIEEREIWVAVSKYHHLPDLLPVKDQQTTYHPTDQPLHERSFHTISAYDQGEKESEAFRQLVFGLQVNGQWYRIEVVKSLESTDALIKS